MDLFLIEAIKMMSPLTVIIACVV